MIKKTNIETRCLVGWKRIAFFLDSSVSTVKRWHKIKKLPLYKTPGGSPADFPEDLKTWMQK